ncbi:MAG: type III polyketide synthase [Candidatus Rokubacteria bacterium]|nr:type III polyketide synthase [Candidatus Rokubacteria bacterium]
MTTPRIVAFATAVPEHYFPQSRLAELASEVAGYHDPRRLGFFAHSEIEGRYLYLDPARVRADESVDELSRRFEQGALALGRGALLSCLDRAGWSPEDVDFLATTTCTGRLCPSLDAHLVRDLGLRPDVQRVHVGDTGCASAMVALQQAYNHLRAFPRHRALVLAVEICSAAYYLDDRLESAVAHAIFADGAGALALGTEGDGISVLGHRTLFRSEHLPAMGFTYPGGRPRVILSKDVRRIGAGMLGEMAEALLASQGLKREDVKAWVLHSAGRRVIERAQKLLGLGDADVAPSRAVLRRYGNMSSATVVFVLEELCRNYPPDPGDWGLMIALGPGFAAEGALLRW